MTAPWPVLSDEHSYQAEVAAIRRNYLALGNRKALGGSLSAAEEKERQCLRGQLVDLDPVTALSQEIVAEAQAIQGTGEPEDRATADKLFQLVAITTRFEGRATTLPEAKSFASVLRRFVARRDLEGAKAWANAQ